MIKEHSKTLQTGGGWSVEHLFLEANEFFLFLLRLYTSSEMSKRSKNQSM